MALFAIKSPNLLPREILDHLFDGEDACQHLLELDLDLVYIATPWDLHTPFAVAAMQAGKYVGVEFNLRATLAENFDISVEQFHILRHIRKGLGSVSELAEARQISRPAVSQAVDILVEKGLVTRKQDLDDRRYVNLVLTQAGNELLNALFKKNRAWMAGLSVDELLAVTSALNILKVVFDEPCTSQ